MHKLPSRLTVGGAPWIACILGPMFSGKTTELLRLHERQMRAGKRCVLVKYAGDTRYDDHFVATHDRKRGEGRTLKATRLWEVEDDIFAANVDVVSIDEGQFFSDLASTCERLAASGKIVHVAALNGDFSKQPFEQVSLLLPHADEMHLLRAVCGCGADASFTFRSTTDKKVVVIGGSEAYKAVCRTCYAAEVREREKHDENSNKKIRVSAATDEEHEDSGPPEKRIRSSEPERERATAFC